MPINLDQRIRSVFVHPANKAYPPPPNTTQNCNQCFSDIPHPILDQALRLTRMGFHIDALGSGSSDPVLRVIGIAIRFGVILPKT
jgi:hypothetical protein